MSHPTDLNTRNVSLQAWREKKQGSLYALKTILSQAGVVLEEEPSQTSSLESPGTTSTSLPSSSFLPSNVLL